MGLGEREGQEMEYAALINVINCFVSKSPLNRVEKLGLENIFEQPLVGVAAAGDPLFEKLKDPAVAGENHLLPGEWLPGAKAVLSYFLPFSEKVRRANRKPGFPAQEWLYGRIEGQQFNEALSKQIAALIRERGTAEALIPALDARFAISDHLVSSWSERHAAYIAGLGTFSLSRSLITAKGCAGRYGSIITSLELPTTKRDYTEPFQNCSFCGECLERCPSGAIEPVGEERKAGMNRSTCKEYLDTKISPRFKPRYGCGKCQTAVQCEHQIPQMLSGGRGC